jgi:hypothetical protein
VSYLKTTDIVTKLRERTDYSTMLLCDPPRPAPDRLCHDAADEIERLREALRLITYGDGDFKLLQSIARAALPKG